MSKYICNTCEATFKQKGHFDSHMKRKRPCQKNTKIEELVEKKVIEILENSFPEFQQLSTEPLEKVSVKPFLTWVGGKTQIIDKVIDRIPKEIANYHEPFLGGGSVLLAVLSDSTIRICGKIYASDLNSNLIGLYKNIQSRVEDLITEVGIFVAEFAECKGTIVNRKPTTIEDAMTSPESYYFWIRSKFNSLSREERKSIKASAMLLFMNKTCFRGVYREGPNGFNVPFGNYKNPTVLDADHIRKISQMIQPVVFVCQDFREALSRVEPGDFVYLDPPYAPENEKSFVSYTADGFDLNAHNTLFAICNEFTAKNVDMLMSNADVKLVRDAFSKYTVNTISCRRAIHSKNPETRTNELLISNAISKT